MIPAIQPFSHSLFCGSFRFVVIMNGNVPAVRHKSFFFLVFPSQIISQELCSGATPPNRTHELVSSTSEKKKEKIPFYSRGRWNSQRKKKVFPLFYCIFAKLTRLPSRCLSRILKSATGRKFLQVGRARVRGGNCVIGKRASLWRRLHRPCPAARAGRRRWEKTVEGNVHKASTAGPSTFCVFHGAI